MVRSPCGPRRISEKNEIMATQTMGVMSTPATGGITLRVPLRMGSVGQAAMLYGKALRSYLEQKEWVKISCIAWMRRAGVGEAYLGNQERIVRKRKSSVKIVNKGPSTSLVGPTQLTSDAPTAGTRAKLALAPSNHAWAEAWAVVGVCRVGGCTGALPTCGGGSRSAAQTANESKSEVGRSIRKRAADA
eukprot:scaffold34883_cov31-Tisochrysis_lutea.AAC.1